eukprot:GFYU01012277.1.p1 GENE.GFYU01012277.1~~GFYU01012277.1.p1  ORF type:complete len:364 (-),score=105.22 GFYU01012277.1:254-1345(-)
MSQEEKSSKPVPPSMRVVVSNTDMPLAMDVSARKIAVEVVSSVKREIAESANKAKNAHRMSQLVAEQLKARFDEAHGPDWHVLVGENFTFNLRFRKKHVMYFSVGALRIVLYQSPVFSYEESRVRYDQRIDEPEIDPSAESALKVFQKPEAADMREGLEGVQKDIYGFIKYAIDKHEDDVAAVTMVKKLMTQKYAAKSGSWHVIVGAANGGFGYMISTKASFVTHVTYKSLRVLIFSHNQLKSDDRQLELGEALKSNVFTPIMKALVYAMGTIVLLLVVWRAFFCHNVSMQDYRMMAASVGGVLASADNFACHKSYEYGDTPMYVMAAFIMAMSAYRSFSATRTYALKRREKQQQQQKHAKTN